MKKNGLEHHYTKLLTELDSISSGNDGVGELSKVVYTSEWVRIYLVGTPFPKKITIQVEISYSGFSLADREHNREPNTLLKQILETHILSLQWLLRLVNHGFLLDIVAEEGIWYAVKELIIPPSDELTRLLSPSEVPSLPIR